MNYKTMRLYDEIRTELLNVKDAEDNAAAWKAEARNRMKDVNALIIAAEKVNKDITIDRKELIAEIRAEITAETEPAENDETEDNGATTDEPEAIPAD